MDNRSKRPDENIYTYFTEVLNADTSLHIHAMDILHRQLIVQNTDVRDQNMKVVWQDSKVTLDFKDSFKHYLSKRCVVPARTADEALDVISTSIRQLFDRKSL